MGITNVDGDIHMFMGDNGLTYIGRDNNVTLVIGLRLPREGRVKVKVEIEINGEITIEREVDISPEEKLINIPFKVVNDDSLSIKVMNCTDTSDILICSAYYLY
jgi:hypothetical protein